jgi:hypothetical protein
MDLVWCRGWPKLWLHVAGSLRWFSQREFTFWLQSFYANGRVYFTAVRGCWSCAKWTQWSGVVCVDFWWAAPRCPRPLRRRLRLSAACAPLLLFAASLCVFCAVDATHQGQRMHVQLILKATLTLTVSWLFACRPRKCWR